jgi:uncharacterized protein YjbI with pentapeptide repeats
MEFSFDENAEYTDRAFERVTYRAKMVNRRAFDNCTFTKCIFQEITFQNCKFRNCTFSGCNLRLMRVAGSSFRETIFKQSAVTGVNWGEGSWSKSGLLDSIGFSESEVSYSVFFGLALTKMVMAKCVAKNADFAEANLTQADFTATDFAEARFLHTNLTEANFTHARNYAIDPGLNNVKGAKFSLPGSG